MSQRSSAIESDVRLDLPIPLNLIACSYLTSSFRIYLTKWSLQFVDFSPDVLLCHDSEESGGDWVFQFPDDADGFASLV